VARPKKARFGFGSQAAEMPFSEAVTDSLRSASSAAGVDLIVLDNCYDGATALRNADEFVKSRPDLVIEFQIDQRVAPVIADKIDGAGIPLIAVDIPIRTRRSSVSTTIGLDSRPVNAWRSTPKRPGEGRCVGVWGWI
jgi:ribose transport system substrate-binding protein